MTDPTATTQILGKAGEPCRECGAPLAADQRYCLNCGTRRAEPRIDFQQHIQAPGVPGSNGSAPAPAQAVSEGARPQPDEAKPQRDYTPLAAVGGIAVLGAMLLIGVLIGKGDSGGSAPPPPAQVIVPGGVADAGKTAADEESGASKAEAKQAKAKGAGKSGGAVEGGSASTGAAPVASNDALQQLQEGTPEEKAENSANLPDEVATPGKPPPEDNEAPGGGSKGMAIE
jgi:hypothetical protein